MNNITDTSIEDNQEQLRTNLPVQNLPYVTVNLGYVENDDELDTGNKEQTATPSPPPEYKSLVNLFLIDAPPKYQDVVPAKSKSDAVTVKIIGKANGETVEVRCDRKALTTWCFILSIIAVLAILSILFVVYNI
ncbi:uncharacterized protein [Clytia hemisphaerica]|uniref:Uncharacterized protein n=1 Tax=Clytia hemisphaerica TaxID=252671 RepID=A0A7M5XEH5_9CNID